MKALFFTILFFGLTLASKANDCNEMTAIRNQFHTATTNKKLQSFLHFAKSIACAYATPYYASAIMKQAEYTLSPIKKLQYFNTGKNMLETFIGKYPDNIEARYVRILVQKNVPAILGYSNQIQTDIAYITSHLAQSNLSASYKQTILKYIKS